MDQRRLEKYAQAARRAFIAAVENRAAHHGLTATSVVPVQVQGSVALIDGRPFPAAVAGKRKKLEARIERMGFARVMEAMAYTWFNRLAALRYMEIHGYLEHGYRVLSHPGDSQETGRLPEILEHAEHVELPGLARDRVVELKLAGDRDAELYRLLLVAQCSALHQAMPFLFPPVGDDTELLLPDNLLHSDSVIRTLVDQIPEDDWQDIEIVGWLYQYYISEKKDQVIGKVVKSEDIPAATQLFTPSWIVKYMVQNSLGAQWLATYPDSGLRAKMEYYIEPVEQTDEVKAQLAEITPESLDPEALTLMDPACGSGHILVEAYDLFKAIYLERGYRPRDIARLILEKNLYGLDIDERAAQLAGFALMMKGRADDRRLFSRGVRLNVLAFVDSAEFDAHGLAQSVDLAGYGLTASDVAALTQLFAHATTFGSLLQVPVALAGKLDGLRRLSEAGIQGLFVRDALERLGALERQAEMLARQYDAVVANPPYMGSKGMNSQMKSFVKKHFPAAKGNLFACFMQRAYTQANVEGHSALVTMQSWMFLSSFQKMREGILRERTIWTMAHLGARAFGSISGEVVQTTAYVLRTVSLPEFKPVFFRLLDGDEEEKKATLKDGKCRFDTVSQNEFKKIPGSPIAYWLSPMLRALFIGIKCGDRIVAKQGLATCNNELFLRSWHEVAREDIGLGLTNGRKAAESGLQWFPYNKGGDYRSWYGNSELVVNWQHEGRDIHRFSDLPLTYAGAPVRAKKFYFRSSVSWTDLTSRGLSARYYPRGYIFDVAGHSAFFESEEQQRFILCFLNTRLAERLGAILNATFHFQVGDFKKLPYPDRVSPAGTQQMAMNAVRTTQADWDAYERSWDFQSLPLLTAADPAITLEASYTAWIANNRETIAEMQRLEEENNRIFIDAYGLQDELTPEVPLEQITLTVNPAYRYGAKLTEDEQWTRFREDSMKELISYAIGCMMSRYSLDAPGLIYAHSGNQGFEPARYQRFPADDDGIIPITDTDWFTDDVCNRLIEFLRTAWPADHLTDNLAYLASALAPRKGEQAADTLRRYLCKNFFKDHLRTYKKRPIYWLFSSGKQQAFTCLVYLHRYHEGTLARMRTEYVIPLLGKLAGRIDQIDADREAATSTAHQRKLDKRKNQLSRQLDELRTFDETLRHFADQRIALDLDDGVKVNYGKFGDLLAGVKDVTGKAPGKHKAA